MNLLKENLAFVVYFAVYIFATFWIRTIVGVSNIEMGWLVLWFLFFGLNFLFALLFYKTQKTKSNFIITVLLAVVACLLFSFITLAPGSKFDVKIFLFLSSPLLLALIIGMFLKANKNPA